MDRGEESRRQVQRELPLELLEEIHRLLPEDPLLHKVLLRRGCDDFIADRFSIHPLAVGCCVDASSGRKSGPSPCCGRGGAESGGDFGKQSCCAGSQKNFVFYSRRGSMRLCVPRQPPLPERLMELFLKRHIQRRVEEEAASDVKLGSPSASLPRTLPPPPPLTDRQTAARSASGGGLLLGALRPLCCCGCKGACFSAPSWSEVEGCKCKKREEFRRGGGGGTHALSELCCPHLCAPRLLQEVAVVCYWPCMADDLRGFLLCRSSSGSTGSKVPKKDGASLGCQGLLSSAERETAEAKVGKLQTPLATDAEKFEGRTTAGVAAGGAGIGVGLRRICLKEASSASGCGVSATSALSAKASHSEKPPSLLCPPREARRRRDVFSRKREMPTHASLAGLATAHRHSASSLQSHPRDAGGLHGGRLPLQSEIPSNVENRFCPSALNASPPGSRFKRRGSAAVSPPSFSSSQDSFVKVEFWIRSQTAAQLERQPEGLVFASAPLLTPLRLGSEFFLLEFQSNAESALSPAAAAATTPTTPPSAAAEASAAAAAVALQQLMLANAAAETVLAAAAVREAALGSLLAASSPTPTSSTQTPTTPSSTTPSTNPSFASLLSTGLHPAAVGESLSPAQQFPVPTSPEEGVLPPAARTNPAVAADAREGESEGRAERLERRPLLPPCGKSAGARGTGGGVSSSGVVAAFLEETARHPLWHFSEASALNNAFCAAATAAEEAEAAVDAQLRLLRVVGGVPRCGPFSDGQNRAPPSESVFGPVFLPPHPPPRDPAASFQEDAVHVASECLNGSWQQPTTTPALADSEAERWCMDGGSLQQQPHRAEEAVGFLAVDACHSVLREEQQTPPLGVEDSLCAEAAPLLEDALLPSLELARPLASLIQKQQPHPLGECLFWNSEDGVEVGSQGVSAASSSAQKAMVLLEGEEGRGETGWVLPPEEALALQVASFGRESSDAKRKDAAEMEDASARRGQEGADSQGADSQAEVLAAVGVGGVKEKVCAFAFAPLFANASSLWLLGYSLWLTCLYTRADAVCAVLFLDDGREVRSESLASSTLRTLGDFLGRKKETFLPSCLLSVLAGKERRLSSATAFLRAFFDSANFFHRQVLDTQRFRLSLGRRGGTLCIFVFPKPVSLRVASHSLARFEGPVWRRKSESRVVGLASLSDNGYRRTSPSPRGPS